MSSTSSGIATLIVAGIANGSFTMPMKYTRKWAWENTWLVWTVFALVFLPFVATLLTIPSLLMVYRSATPDIILEVCAFGAGWGVAQVLFGLAVEMIGIALAFSVVLGTSAAVGKHDSDGVSASRTPHQRAMVCGAWSNCVCCIGRVFWFGNTLQYGLAAGQLGPWGSILGWPLLCC